jgi:hypothetical protein
MAAGSCPNWLSTALKYRRIMSFCQGETTTPIRSTPASIACSHITCKTVLILPPPSTKGNRALGTTLVRGFSLVPLPATGISALPIMILRLTASRFGPFPEPGQEKDLSKYPKDYGASQQCRTGAAVSSPFVIFVRALETNIRPRMARTWMQNSCRALSGSSARTPSMCWCK